MEKLDSTFIDPHEVSLQAQKEFKEELHKQAVEKYKERLRLRQNLWIRLFPWRLRFERRDIPALKRETLGLTRYTWCLDTSVRELENQGFNVWIEERIRQCSM